jgi:hypothetical protein
MFHQNLKLTQLKRKLNDAEINGYSMFGEWTETDRHIATLNYEITMWESSQGQPLKRFPDCCWDRNKSQGIKPQNTG